MTGGKSWLNHVGYGDVAAKLMKQSRRTASAHRDAMTTILWSPEKGRQDIEPAFPKSVN